MDRSTNAFAEPAVSSAVQSALEELSGAVRNLGMAEDAIAAQLEIVRIQRNETAASKAPTVAPVPIRCNLETQIHEVIGRIENITAHLNLVREELRV